MMTDLIMKTLVQSWSVRSCLHLHDHYLQSDTMSSYAETPAAATVTAEDKNKQYLGEPVAAVPQTHLQADSVNIPQGISQHDLKVFEQLYKKHCEVSSKIVC